MPVTFRVRPLWIAAAGALAAVTCDDAKPAVSLADDIAAEFCAQEFACCSPFEISLITSDRYTTEEGCVAFSTIDARTQLGAVEGAIAQGRITVDETRLAACAMAYAGRHCGTSAQAPSTFSPLPSVADFIAACPGLLVGHVADGQACNLAAECQAGARCATGAPASGAGGIAGVPTGVGGTSGAIANAPGVCLRYQQRDQPCNSSSDCDPAADLACRKPDFRCSDPLQEGEPCTVQNDPFTGLLSDDCDARKGLFCDFPGSFVCRHIPRADEPCSQFRLPQCDPDPALGLSCNAFSNTCKSPGHDGDACGAPAIPPCRDDLACRPTQPDGIGTCDSLPALGDPCIDRCASPAICVNRVCTAPGSARLGAACETNNDCASLYCAAFNGATKLCAAPPIASPICVGAGVTPAGGGAGGTFGTGVGGFGGTFTTGTAGSVAVGTSGRTGRGGTVGTAGAGGSAGAGGASGSAGAGGGVSLGCPLSEPAMGDPLIADFSVDGATTFPIGGTFTFSTMQPLGPAATVAGGALHITADVPGVMNAQFLGAGIFFFGNPPGLGCIDAAFHTGVQFDVSGTIDGAGCTAHFAVNDSAHTDNTLDAKGAGPMGVYAPQAPFDVTATPTTIMIPFAGPGAPTDGNPAIPLDPSKLTGVQWQFTVGADPGDSCAVEIAIDNVRFF